jgi:hypothetical protein
MDRYQGWLHSSTDAAEPQALDRSVLSICWAAASAQSEIALSNTLVRASTRSPINFSTGHKCPVVFTKVSASKRRFLNQADRTPVEPLASDAQPPSPHSQTAFTGVLVALRAAYAVSVSRTAPSPDAGVTAMLGTMIEMGGCGDGRGVVRGS